VLVDVAVDTQQRAPAAYPITPENAAAACQAKRQHGMAIPMRLVSSQINLNAASRQGRPLSTID